MAPRAMSISLAGMPIRLSSGDAAVLPALAGRFGGFLCRRGPAAASIEIRTGRGLSFLPEGPRGEDFRLEVERSGETLRAVSYHFRGEYDLGSRRGWVETDDTCVPASLDNYLRCVGADLLVRDGGFLLHAAGIVRRGKGCLFLGPSGAGKSTVASTADERDVLSDDLVALRRSGDGFRVFSIPMQGEKNFHARDARVAAVFILRKSRRNALEPVSPAHGAAMVLGGLPFLSDEERIDPGVLGLAAGLARAVPLYLLHFTKGPLFWRAVEGALR